VDAWQKITSMDELIQQLINGLLLGCNYTLVAIGFSLFFGALNVIHFSHGDVCIVGAFALLLLHTLASALGYAGALHPLVYLPLLVLAAVAITGVSGVVLERLVIKPFRHAPLLMVLVSTVMLGTVIREAIRLWYPRGNDPQIFARLLPQHTFAVGDVMLSVDSLIIIAVTVLVIVLLFLFIQKTRTGAAIRAISQDGEAAMMMGVNMNRTVAVTFLLGSALGAVAGILIGSYNNIIRFDMGLMLGIKGFSAAVVGGLGNVYGAIVGGLILGLVETIVAGFVPGGSPYADAFSFFVVILFLVFRPYGVLGEKVSEKV
jgi:branched-chain amino acid transport system permease protein